MEDADGDGVPDFMQKSKTNFNAFFSNSYLKSRPSENSLADFCISESSLL